MEGDVILSIATYEPLTQLGEQVVWFIERAYERVLTLRLCSSGSRPA